MGFQPDRLAPSELSLRIIIIIIIIPNEGQSQAFQTSDASGGIPDIFGVNLYFGRLSGTGFRSPNTNNACLSPSLASSSRSQAPPTGPEANPGGSEALGESWRRESYK